MDTARAPGADGDRRAFQREVGDHLRAGRSVLLVAPTGFGKTRAAIDPFVAALNELRRARPDTADGAVPDELGRVGTRLLFVLPLRALASGVAEEFTRAVRRQGEADDLFRMVIHHGGAPESEVFCENAIATTIDQYLTAFAGAPLSFADASGHAAAGATIASYTVFDEVQLLEPRRGLPLLAAVLILRRRWRLPTVVMTATLPRAVRQFLAQHGGLQVVEPSPDEIREGRDAWRRVTLAWQDELSEDAALALAEHLYREHGRVLWFVNRVGRAQSLYVRLRSAGVPAMLIHSRFREADRAAIEDELRKRLGPLSDSAPWQGVVVTTQVCEAGLNLSVPVVLSEACPADSLVQRAGRCARFRPLAGGEARGEVHVYQPAEKEAWRPYEEAVWRTSLEVVKGMGGAVLDWATETDLVDRALGELYDWYVRGEGAPRKSRRPRDFAGLTPADALGEIERAYRARDPRPVEEILREFAQVQLSICTDHRAFQAELTRNWRAHNWERSWPESIAVPIWEVRRRAESLAGRLFELVRKGSGTEPSVVPVAGAGGVRVGRHYVVTADAAGYDAELGLAWEAGGGRETTGWKKPSRRSSRAGGGRAQGFVEHAEGVLERAEAMFELYRPFVLGWLSGVFGDEAAALVLPRIHAALREAWIFHDVGKLKSKWQAAIREAAGSEADLPADPFVARTRTRGRSVGVPHAPDAFPFLLALWELPLDGAREPALVSVAGATARHHSIPLLEDAFPERVEDGLAEGALSPLRELARIRLGEGAAARVERAVSLTFGRPGPTGRAMRAADLPSPSDDVYPLYTWANRLVKMADREDAGGEVKELPWLRSS